MIISVGYRVKSQRGVLFRRWANKILKEFLVQGYAINEKRIAALMTKNWTKILQSVFPTKV